MNNAFWKSVVNKWIIINTPEVVEHNAEIVTKIFRDTNKDSTVKSLMDEVLSLCDEEDDDFDEL